MINPSKYYPHELCTIIEEWRPKDYRDETYLDQHIYYLRKIQDLLCSNQDGFTKSEKLEVLDLLHGLTSLKRELEDMKKQLSSYLQEGGSND